MSFVKIGVGGPVGSGKTALIERLTRKMSKDYSICVITNDIYTKEDAEFLIKNSALPKERIMGVETGGCPHTAIREDCSMNLEAVEEMAEKYPLYRFEQHKGYGTKLHYAMLDRYGPCPIHRRSFLKKWEAARHG